MRFRAIAGAAAVAFLLAFGPPVAEASAAVSPAPVAPGAAAGFAVLGGTTVTSAGVSTLTGDLGVSPGTAVTGFPPVISTAPCTPGTPSRPRRTPTSPPPTRTPQDAARQPRSPGT